jgi:PAS fold
MEVGYEKDTLLFSVVAEVRIWAFDSSEPCPFLGRTTINAHDSSPDEEDQWVEDIHPADFERVIKCYADATSNSSPFRITYRMRGAHGDYAWFVDVGLPVFAPDGACEGYVGTLIPTSASPKSRRRQRGANCHSSF